MKSQKNFFPVQKKIFKKMYKKPKSKLYTSKKKKLKSILNFITKKNILSKSKISQGHIEVILSMILFVGFLIFLFIFTNPFLKVKEEPKIIDVQKAVIKKITSDIGILSVILDNENNCYSLNDVKNNFGDSFIEIKDINNPRRYTIYYGDFFNKTKSGVKSCSCSIETPCFNESGNKLYTIGLYIDDKIIVNESIKEFKQVYDSDYQNLKQSLGVRDFLFTIKDINNNKIPSLSVNKNIPKSTSVISKNILLRVMNKNGEISELILNLKAW